MKRNHPPDPSRCGRSHRLFTCTHIGVINASDVTDLVTHTRLSKSSSPSCKHPHTQPKHRSKNTQLSPTHTLTHRTDMQPCNLHDSEHVCNYTACVRRSTLKHQRQLLQLSPPRTRAWMSICHVFIFPIPKLFSLCDSILAHVFSYNPVGCTREEKRTRKQDFNAQKSRVLSPWQATWNHKMCKYLNYFSRQCANANLSSLLLPRSLCRSAPRQSPWHWLKGSPRSVDDGWRCWFWRSCFLPNKNCLLCTTQSERGHSHRRNPTECWWEARFTVRLCTLEHKNLIIQRVRG